MSDPSGASGHSLIPLAIPVYPQMAEVLHYPGQVGRVAFFLENAGHEAMYHDGLLCTNGVDKVLFAEFLRYPRVKRALVNHPIISNDADGTTLYWIVLDRTNSKLYVAKPADALQFLLDQYDFEAMTMPLQPDTVSSSELEALGKQTFEEAIQPSQWHQTPGTLISIVEVQALMIIRDIEARQFIDWLDTTVL